MQPATRGTAALPAEFGRLSTSRKENRASRPLSRSQTIRRHVSSWVGDHQRIHAVDCFCYLATCELTTPCGHADRAALIASPNYDDS
jgi:hypothetical protein